MFAAQCRWIWLDDCAETENQYVGFRRDFTLTQKPDSGRLLISADSDYQVFLNGLEIYGRQFSDYPQERSFDVYPVGDLLRRGRNAIAVLGYYRGRGASDYRSGRPGLIVQLEAGATRIVSDSQWRARLSPAYASGGQVDQVTKQMGFVVVHDARREDGWTSLGYQVGRGWRRATELAGPTDGYWRALSPRALPQMVRRPFSAAKVVCLGTAVRLRTSADLSPSLAVASEFKHAVRPPPSHKAPWRFAVPEAAGQGGYVLADLGAESFGLLRIELEAPAGTVVDVAHGEQLEDLGVRAAPGYRRFVDRFICAAGRQVLQVPFRRLGGRYIELHLFGFTRPVQVHAVGLEPLEYPVVEAGSFACADTILTRLQEVSLRTLKLCMGDHYFDCPWREQSLYSYDSRNQALYGYYAFGEYAYPRQSFRLLGWGGRADGLLEMCAPASVDIVIPIFSLVWIRSLQEHWLFSGDSTLFDEFQPVIERILGAFLARVDEPTGVTRTFAGLWSFYEWTTGLDYQPKTGPGSGFRLDAPHNMYLIDAMRAYAAMLAFKGHDGQAKNWRRKADALAAAVHRLFWDPARQRYATYADRRRRRHYAAGIQALAIATGVVPAGLRRPLQAALVTDESLVEMTLQVMGVGVHAMRQASVAEQGAMLKRVRGVYGGMVMNGATSLWEVADKSAMAPGLENDSGRGHARERIPYEGDDMFAEAGSLCHGWSAVPIWLNMAYILGVCPLTPGFKTFAVEPHPCGLPGASGSIPTPHGQIHVAWEQGRGGSWIDVSAPRSLTPVIRPGPGFSKPVRISVNGQRRAG